MFTEIPKGIVIEFDEEAHRLNIYEYGRRIFSCGAIAVQGLRGKLGQPDLDIVSPDMTFHLFGGGPILAAEPIEEK